MVLLTRRLRVLIAGVTALVSTGAAVPDLWERGRRLYAGESPISARMVGHETALPADATRCSNCHQRERDKSDPTTPSFATRLGPATLTQSIARRGGPASRYDEKAFCRVLRDGIDPAYVMIPQTMPRYSLSAADCEAMWTFLTAP